MLPPIVDRRRRYKSIGETAGALAGAAVGGLTPLILGGDTGDSMLTQSIHGADQVNEYLERNTLDDAFGPGAGNRIADTAGDVGRIGGWAAGAALSPLGALGGAMLGANAGRTLGREVGSLQTSLMSPENRAREFVRKMPRMHGLALRDAALSVGNHHVVHAIDDEMRRPKLAARPVSVHDLIDVGGAPKPKADIRGTGEAIGRGLGSLYGLGMALGAPAIGHFAGEAVGNSLATIGHSVGDAYDMDLAGPAEAVRAFGKPAGTIAGGALGLAYLGARAAAPSTLSNIGGAVGHRFGRLFEGFVPKHQHIASRIYDAPPEHAYAFLKSLENDPFADPSDVAVARKAYNFRRAGASGLLKAASVEWSLEDPTRPQNRRSGSALGALVGAGLGALALPLMSHGYLQAEIDPATNLPMTEDHPDFFHHLGNRLSDTNRAHIQTAAMGTGAFAGALAGSGLGAGIGALRDMPRNSLELGRAAYRATGRTLPGLAAGTAAEIEHRKRYDAALETARRSIAQGA